MENKEELLNENMPEQARLALFIDDTKECLEGIVKERFFRKETGQMLKDSFSNVANRMDSIRFQVNNANTDALTARGLAGKELSIKLRGYSLEKDQYIKNRKLENLIRMLHWSNIILSSLTFVSAVESLKSFQEVLLIEVERANS